MPQALDERVSAFPSTPHAEPFTCRRGPEPRPIVCHLSLVVVEHHHSLPISLQASQNPSGASV